MSEILAAAFVAQCHHASPFIDPDAAGEHMRQLCDSHEALRAQVAAQQQEIADYKATQDGWQAAVRERMDSPDHTTSSLAALTVDLEAKVARLEAALAERDNGLRALAKHVAALEAVHPTMFESRHPDVHYTPFRGIRLYMADRGLWLAAIDAAGQE